MSRDAILAAVRACHADAAPLPAIPSPEPDAWEALADRFRTALEQVGGRCVVLAPGGDLDAIIRRHYPDARRIVSTLEGPPGSTVTVTPETAPADLVLVQLAIMRGRLGVAEDAAVWVDGGSLPHRALPFVAEHCVLLVAMADLVPDLHAAYAALQGHLPDYGVFVSGPSKTADIEQSLVIGAQGPRSALVILEG